MGLTDMSSSLERGLSVLDLLSTHPEGMAVGQVASALDLPPSGVHRMLNQLVEYGYVHQDGTKSAYVLGMKLPALGLAYLAQSGITDIAQPILDRLAAQTQLLIRLSVIDGEDLVESGRRAQRVVITHADGERAQEEIRLCVCGLHFFDLSGDAGAGHHRILDLVFGHVSLGGGEARPTV